MPTPADTRQRLLDAAREEFLAHGYVGTTLRAVAKRAGVSLNLIHYHFDGKDGLLAECVVGVMHGSRGTPPPSLADAPDDPVGQLRAFIVWQVTRMLATEAAGVMKLVLNEFKDPSPLIDKIAELGARPTVAACSEMVRAILPPHASDDVVRRCCMSVIGQITHYKHGWPIISRVYPDLTLDDSEAAEIAEHVARFSLAGVLAERDRLSEGRS